ncbi:MAG: S1 RNA-binding domain-containing protein [Thermoleophilia bacterium]
MEGTVIEVVKAASSWTWASGLPARLLVDIRRVQTWTSSRDASWSARSSSRIATATTRCCRGAVLEDERREVRQKILDEPQPGQVVEGTISNIVDFGAFVDLEGIDGLIHISELSWSHVNHPSEVLAIGDKVEVKVLDIDRDRCASAWPQDPGRPQSMRRHR